MRGWGRTKRWEYWGVVTPTHVIGVVASSIDYAGVHGLYVLDRATGEETATDVVVPLARVSSCPTAAVPAAPRPARRSSRSSSTRTPPAHGSVLRPTT
ncbi:DUF2804 family protein [Oerskovia sp. M15]